jgi:hypothetical protein
MTPSTAPARERIRRIVDHTFGEQHGPITRLMSPSDLGRKLKPFVFLDLFDSAGGSFSCFGWHPHSGIATIDFQAQADTEFVVGSAASHPRDLVLGHYSVHTSQASLATAERRIAEIKPQLPTNKRN